MPVLPAVHLLTCPARAAVLAETLASWARTDWPGPPCVHHDDAPERPDELWGTTARVPRMLRAYARMLEAALATDGADDDWLLFLEDDLDFHPRLASILGQWGLLGDPACTFASLFNPSLREHRGLLPRDHAFVAEITTFLGAQAILLRRGAAWQVLLQWDKATGMASQRMASISAGRWTLWVHRPSLVQHTALDSGWGARQQRALDFDAAWAPPPPLPDDPDWPRLA